MGYVLGGSNDDAECPGLGHCCGAGWTIACGEACAKKNCVEGGGTWIEEVDYDFRPFTCEVGKNPEEENPGESQMNYLK